MRRTPDIAIPDLSGRLAVVTGASDFDRSWDSAARKELTAFSADLTIVHFAGEMAEQIRAERGSGAPEVMR